MYFLLTLKKHGSNGNIYFVVFSLFFSFTFFSVSSQNTVDCINPEKIHQKHKYKFIHNKYLENISYLDSLRPECYQNKDSENYNYQYDSFIIKEDINTVWEKYKTINLKDAYSGNLVSLGFVYSKRKKKIYYADDNYDGIKEGQIYFIRLNLLGGLKRIVVAYEVTRIDDKRKTIRFCYINNGISTGSQQILLHKTENNFTKVEHKTFYKSKSKFRDKHLYPKFHKKVVAELHHNLMKALSESRALSVK
ncbi:MAG: hypothetical protein GXO50_09320 [Chlorobi bacterium]|nr:hypothetical protein [Chlorobiota bacterium]